MDEEDGHLALGGGDDEQVHEGNLNLNLDNDDNDEGTDDEEEEYVPPVDVIIDGINYGNRDNLTEITLPEGTLEVPDYAFYDSRSLHSCILPNSVLHLGKEAFTSCHSLQTINLPSNLYSIGEEAFGFSDLGSIDIPATVRFLGEGLFQDTSINSVVIPEGVTKIHDITFNSCGHLQTVVSPQTITEIGDMAFTNCHTLVSINIPDVEYIPNSCFRYNLALKTIHLPQSVKQIHEEGFSKCKSLTTINLDSVEYFGELAFENCVALSSIIINDEADVRPEAFKGCTLLEARSLKFKMTVASYFRKSHQQRIIERVSVLCATKMLLQMEMGIRPQRRRLNNDVNDEGGDVVYLNGRLAWKMLTEFHLWIKIVGFI